MFVPAGSPIFFLREHRFAVRCHVVTLRQLLWTLLFMLSTCLLHMFLYIFFINIGCATLYHLSMIYVTVYNMSFNSNYCILAAELNYIQVYPHFQLVLLGSSQGLRVFHGQIFTPDKHKVSAPNAPSKSDPNYSPLKKLKRLEKNLFSTLVIFYIS